MKEHKGSIFKPNLYGWFNLVLIRLSYVANLPLLKAKKINETFLFPTFQKLPTSNTKLNRLKQLDQLKQF